VTIDVVAVGALSLGATLALTPWATSVGMRLGAVDKPDPLSIHSIPTPRSGGIALLCGALSFTVFALLVSGVESDLVIRWTVAAVAFTAVGFADDVHGIPARLKLLLQFLAAILIVVAVGAVAVTGVAQIDIVLTVVVPVAAANAVNLIDGMDGLAAGTTAVIALALLLLDAKLAVAAVVLVGTAVGFFVYNRPGATVFMGDGGSNLLGALLGLTALELASHWPTASGLVAIPACLGFPAADFSAAAIRRVRRRASMWSGDREHFYDLLLSRGRSQWNVLVLCCAATALGGVVASVARLDWRIGLIVLIVLWMLFLFVVLRLPPRGKKT
jgi:UDP-GlcNAc:undecaprenyl-phosphate GlcNAc-1-phosphate transferase